MRISSVPISGDRMALAFSAEPRSILGRAGSAHTSEHSRKVLPRFEAAGQRQHVLRPLQQLGTILYSEMIYVSSMTIEPAVANIILCERTWWSFQRKVVTTTGLVLPSQNGRAAAAKSPSRTFGNSRKWRTHFRKTGFTRTSFFQRSRRSRRRRLRGAAPRSRRDGSG
jgi:hypothetical protein